MWKIKLSDRNDSLETIKFHKGFTSLNKIFTFSLTHENEAIRPIEIKFVAKRDETQKKYTIQSSPLENDSMTITFFNPATGHSGLKEPMIILENDNWFFKVMFNTNMVTESDFYLLTIEFFIQKK